MKVLSTEQQTDLRELLVRLTEDGYQADLGDMAQLEYWAIELKPKRVRKKKEIVQEAVDNPQ